MHFDLFFDLFRPQNRCSRVDGSSILEKATIPLPSSILSPKMLPKAIQSTPRRLQSAPRAPRELPERSPEGPWELSGALLEVPNRSQELHKPQHDPPGAQKAAPRGLWAVIWRLLEASGPHFGASEACFDRFQDTFRSLKSTAVEPATTR